ncbi:MAG: tRNA (adenosine(37)-N6)-threonylcarbamoyltransferase complex dimerization subunit type 1 TsaB [Deltaproteobacteria bacterium]|nr:tRNA (adenosine(37)-N6)-threonylcarbamoyltransferase complex dimerization subunit type 1 TsaB [Deltaproteobacteria bacterium]
MSDRAAAPRWLLAIDASTPRCAVALGHIDPATGVSTLVVDDTRDDGPNQASVRLFPRIEDALAIAGIGPHQLAAIACGRGPGTFTGTRVAVASAKGLAYGVGCPVISVSTLAAMAASADHQGTVLAVLDARRGEVYGGTWRCEHGPGQASTGPQPQGEERVAPLAELLAAMQPCPDDLRVVGSGVEPYRDALPAELAATALSLPGPTGAGLWTVAVSAWAAGATIHPAALDAVYLRASYAEMGVHPPKRPFVKSPFV